MLLALKWNRSLSRVCLLRLELKRSLYHSNSIGERAQWWAEPKRSDWTRKSRATVVSLGQPFSFVARIFVISHDNRLVEYLSLVLEPTGC